jgi:hypothetical protein
MYMWHMVLLRLRSGVLIGVSLKPGPLLIRPKYVEVCKFNKLRTTMHQVGYYTH